MENNFVVRHIGPFEKDFPSMLDVVNVDSLDELIAQTIPSSILLKEPLKLPPAMDERTFLNHMRGLSRKNKVYKTYIGLGYYNCVVPSVILRNVLENPGWYTPYTPYQSEIAQGRLEALLNFQTVVCDLTAMDISNASLLDEGTAAAEAMTMMYRVRSKALIKRGANKFFVSSGCFPQTIEVIYSRAEPLGIDLVVGDFKEAVMDESFFGALVQYPDANGQIHDYRDFARKVHRVGALFGVCADILALTLLVPPGEFGADVVVGSTQRLGVPMGYGGPHAAYFATREEFKRQVPGRIIGVSIDRHGRPAYRMALQTREQHIRREKATSNICTAQSLLAVMAAMYCVYHGPEGLKKIAKRIHAHTRLLEDGLIEAGFSQRNDHYFDTLWIDITSEPQGLSAKVRELAERRKMNFRYFERGIGISLDETTSLDDVNAILRVFYEVKGKRFKEKKELPKNLLDQIKVDEEIIRRSDFLTHEVFNRYHSETEMLRYLKRLENKDLSLTHSMIPLGSCTMKLNATTEMIPITWPEFSDIHPFVPPDQAQGYREIIKELEDYLCEITGLAAASLQPNSGAQGEYAGLKVIRAYHRDRGDVYRDVVLIPSSAHGTNPASASIAGMWVVVVKCDERGNIDIKDLKAKCEQYRDELAAIMITYPSTHGVFEPQIQKVCQIVHDHGGQVYMDGANLNAQVGLTTPAIIGADVCHINLHKTFGIPHGGGGPGMGPICVASHLAKYLPGHPLVKDVGGEKAISAVSSAPWGSASILLISYAYIRLLGSKGVTEATKYAILNANYMKNRLEQYYPILYQNEKGRVAHEFIVDLRRFKKSAGVDAEDVAKRLMDYGFHAPTMSWPVPGTIMIEPTESESKEELDRFCEALIEIRNEIEEIEKGKYDQKNNVLKNSPHVVREAIEEEWKYPYPKKKAYYPLDFVKENKFWVPVSRVNNPYGDRNLVCTCLPVEAYQKREAD